MLQVLSLMSKVVFSPVWILWKGYTVLWWAFEGFGRPMPADGGPEAPERGASFEITDSRPRESERQPPTTLLKAGFAGTLLASSGAGVLALVLSGTQALSGPHAWMAWGWGTVVGCMLSIFAVRRVADSQARRKTVRQRIQETLKRAGHRVAESATESYAAARKAAGYAAAGSVAQPQATASGDEARDDGTRNGAARAKRVIGRGARVAAECSAAGCAAAWSGVKHAAATYRNARSAAEQASPRSAA